MFHEHTDMELLNNKDARIEYFLDGSSMPQGLTQSSDICLGLIEGDTTTLVNTNWKCVTNSWNMTDDGWISFPFRKGGFYSLIVSPDAELIPASKLCGFWCDYQ
jgi:hypothetical protein